MALLWALFVGVALGADFGIVGLPDTRAFKLLDLLAGQQHRVACFDEDSALTNSVIKRRGIASFSGEHVAKFAPVVIVLQKDAMAFLRGLDNAAAKGREFVFFDRSPEEGKELLEAAAAKGATGVLGEFFNDGDSAHLLAPTGAEPLRQALRKSPVEEDPLVVDESKSVPRKRDLVACPWQAAGSSFWTKRFTATELGCVDDTLSVCRIYVRLPKPEDRLIVIALYNVDGPIHTDDPQGFFNAFPSVKPPSDATENANGKCDSFITFGVTEGETCATADPSFNRTAFLKGGAIAKDTGFFCASPKDPNTSPSTAIQPPNTADSILIAQLTTRRGYALKGQAVIISADENRVQSTVKQSFDCDCVPAGSKE